MGDDVAVRKLAGLVLLEQVLNSAEMTAPNSSIPPCLLTRDFAQSMRAVLRTKQIFTLFRWQTFVDTCYGKMFSSHEMYLRYIMFACQIEDKCHREIFESFISVLAVLILLSSEAYAKTGMDFRDLNLDIFMVFYQSAIKKRFRKDGGFQKLVKYIRGHRYLKWNNIDGPKNFDDYKSLEIAEGRVVCVQIVKPDEPAKDTTSSFLAQKFLSKISVRFPALLSKDELVLKLVAFRRNEITENAETKREIVAALVGEDNKNSNLDSKTNGNSNSDSKINGNSNSDSKTNGNSNSDSKINHTAEQKEEISNYEDIIEAVIRYNQSKSSGQEKANNRLQQEANKILEHLKDNIQSFIEILDEYDEE